MDAPSRNSRPQEPSTPRPLETPPEHVRRPLPGITHLAVVAGFILPIALLPYLLARRQLSVLRQQLAETQAGLRVLHQELNLTWREAVNGKDEIQRVRTLLHQIKHDDREGLVSSERKDAERKMFEEEIKSDLQSLLKEAQSSRARALTLRALGASLADIAAFMHEIELEMGLASAKNADKRGIERLRSLALKMEESSDPSDKSSASQSFHH